uniref:Uncharacterized protein n=1 Tax=Eutreptiella gymnastica TaxID=73025 RepID=A0A6U8FYC8_9EUGL
MGDVRGAVQQLENILRDRCRNSVTARMELITLLLVHGINSTKAMQLRDSLPDFASPSFVGSMVKELHWWWPDRDHAFLVGAVRHEDLCFKQPNLSIQGPPGANVLLLFSPLLSAFPESLLAAIKPWRQSLCLVWMHPGAYATKWADELDIKLSNQPQLALLRMGPNGWNRKALYGGSFSGKPEHVLAFMDFLAAHLGNPREAELPIQLAAISIDLH